MMHVFTATGVNQKKILLVHLVKLVMLDKMICLGLYPCHQQVNAELAQVE